MANSNFSVVELDFDTLKSSFINYLKTQTQFSDYNFEGSAINSLLDVMSYNTFKNSFYLNMAMSEAFLDSAQMKQSMFSHAKELNYLPRSARSSVAKVRISFEASGDSAPYIIRRGSEFQTIVKQRTYTFTTDSDIVVNSTAKNPTLFTATFDIYEGPIVSDTYVMDYNTASPRFAITNPSVDTDSVQVLVFENNETTGKVYTRTNSLLDLTEKSEVYFIQASYTGSYEIVFGDGVLGKKPKNGSTIQISYRVTKGPEGNGAQEFIASFDPTGISESTTEVTVETLSFTGTSDGKYSVNGAEAESIESIRFSAPRAYQTQERAVTAKDYEVILKNQYPEINAISVFGGEEASPPQYGKVFISVDLKNVIGLPDAKKTEYYNFIRTRSPLTIDPIFIEPDYTFVKITSDVSYNVNTTSKSRNTIESVVIAGIRDYIQTTASGFGSTLYYSKLISAIDDLDPSIISNSTDAWLYKKITPKPGVAANYNLNFKTKLKETYYVLDTVRKNKGVVTGLVSDEKLDHIVSSSPFIFRGSICELEDNGDGEVRIVRKVGTQHKVLKAVGTVNYKTGAIRLKNFLVDSFEGDSIKIYVEPDAKNITAKQNTILETELTEITVNVKAIRE